MTSVTEVLMGCGSFTIDLDPATPRSIVEELPTWSTVCVTPGRCTGLDRDEVLALASYSGILRSRSENLCRLTGPSILAWLGDEDGKGPYVTDFYDGTGGADQLITDIFTDGALPEYRTNGLTLGTNGLASTVVWAEAGPTVPVDITRASIDSWCRFLGWKYRVNPDGTFDIDEGDGLFVTTPTMLVVPSWWADGPADPTYRVVAGRVSATNSNDDYATDVQVYDGTYPGSADVGAGTEPFMFGYEGVTRAVIQKNVSNGTDFTSTGDADSAAEQVLLRDYSTRNLIDISVPLDDPRAHVEPGDSIYVCDLLQGLVLAGVVEVDVLGQVMFPIEVAVQEMTWPVCEGMGVYVVENDTGSVVDLSEFVLWGSGDASLRVGAKWPTLREVVNGRN